MNIDNMTTGLFLNLSCYYLCKMSKEDEWPIVEPTEQKALISNSDFNQDSLYGLK